MSDETRDANASEEEFLKMFEDADTPKSLKTDFLNGFLQGYREARRTAAASERNFTRRAQLKDFLIKANTYIAPITKQSLTEVGERFAQTQALGKSFGWFLFSIEKLLGTAGFEGHPIDKSYMEEITAQVGFFASKLKELERGIPLTEIKKRVRRIANNNKMRLNPQQKVLLAKIAAILAK